MAPNKRSSVSKRQGKTVPASLIGNAAATTVRNSPAQQYSLLSLLSLLLLLLLPLLAWTLVFYARSASSTPATVATASIASASNSQHIARQLLIASHNQLLVYDVDTEEYEALVAFDRDSIPMGAVFYSVFPSQTPERTLYCALRGDLNQGDLDFLVEIDFVERRVVSKQAIKLPNTSFTHEVVRWKDKVYCADTGSGGINVLSFPGFQLEARFQKFEAHNHLNSISPTKDGNRVWATLLNHHGPSFAALFDANGQVIQRVENIGLHAHSWVEWTEDRRVYLSSKEAMLCVYDFKTGKREVMYTSTLHNAKTRPMFLKGLTVVANVAYFGESAMQDRRGRETVPCALVAVDLLTKRVLFYRTDVGSIGLINTISLLGVQDATFRAQPSFPVAPFVLSKHAPCPGYAELRSALRFAEKKGYAFGRFPRQVDIAQLPYQVDSVSGLAQDVAALVKKFGWTLRPDVNNYFILLLTQHGIATDQSNVGPFQPVPGRMELAPNMRKLFNQLGFPIGRTRLMMIRPGEEVKIHFDRTDHINTQTGRADVNSGYWGRRFRVHVPIQTHEDVKFTVGKSEIHMPAGKVYIFDNSKMHKVTNQSNQTRIHLVIDTVGGPRFFRALQRAKLFLGKKEEQDADFVLHPLSQFVNSAGGSEKFLVEEWADAPVHTPMPVSTITKYFENQIAPHLLKKDSARALEIVQAFNKRWAAATKRGTAAAVDVWHQLLSPAICSNIVLENGYTLYEAMEPLARMAFYKCVNDEAQIGSLCHAKHV